VRPILAIWKDGRIVPTRPVDWPEGTNLNVKPIEPTFGVEEDLQGDDPDSIARWIATFDALPPLQLSEAEEGRWRAARREVAEYTLARMQERAAGERP
jgi:hypothetical protein